MKLVCAPQGHAALARLPNDHQAVVLFERTTQPDIITAGASVVGVVRKLKLSPAPRAWDLLAIALAVNSADAFVPRAQSPDGWTRDITLKIAVEDANFWTTQTSTLEKLLKFLTTDMWQLEFIRGGGSSPQASSLWAPDEDSVVLLSGGLDSLTGAINLVHAKHRPMAVSQVSNGDKEHQAEFAKAIGGGLSHLQLNHNIKTFGPGERSQRARSLIFLAYGAIAATSLKSYGRQASVPLFMPENGFISINPPLTPSRIGSLSTRTTHPAMLSLLQSILDQAGVAVAVRNPFQFKSKGELLVECKDQHMLARLARLSTSCGRFARNGFQQCGRCVPCLIRRASFHHWGRPDRTGYVYADLSKKDSKHAWFDDVRSMASAVESVKRDGLERWLGQSVNSALVGDPTPFIAVVGRGLNEMEAFLKARRVR